MHRSYNFATVVAFVLTLGAASSKLEAQYSGPVAIKQHTETVAVPPPVQDQIVANIVGGAALNSGNTRAYTVSLGGHLGLIRDKNQFMLDVLGLVNAAKPARGNPDDDKYVKTAANVVGRARYDRFLSKNDALFLAVVPRRDVLAGLNLRLQMQAGYSRNLYAPSEKQRFWAEAGYDLTYDDFSTITTVKEETITVPEALRGPAGLPPGTDIISRTTTASDPGHDFVNSARLFFGYTNTMTAAAMINLGAEVLFDVTDGKNVRVNTLADFTTSLSTRFKLGFVSRMFFDNVPPENARKTDFVSTLQVIYTYDSLEGVKKGAACDCTANVQKATEEAQAACAKQYGAPVPEESVLQEPAGVQIPTTTTTPNAATPVPNTPAADTTPVTPPTTTAPAPAAPAKP